MQTTVRVQKVRPRAGFTLIEIVVVVLLIGIIAATAAPRMFDTATAAKENTARQSLNVLRDAIELHKAQEGTYPAGGTLAAELLPYIKGPFPKVQIAGAIGDGSVDFETDGNGVGAPTGLSDWLYDSADGTLIINLSPYHTH